MPRPTKVRISRLGTGSYAVLAIVERTTPTKTAPGWSANVVESFELVFEVRRSSDEEWVIVPRSSLACAALRIGAADPFPRFERKELALAHLRGLEVAL